ncbi:hypothetical protein SAMN04489726_4601 [Allokutzneria albata]|uniref:Uncharacterized protein n=1 Tax=Allokutzneria albata TaxID=211114 RepID=A0A1G9Y6G9_ALLAB|nr:hypothetical protein SAMN04489726_4601 [Allokutzneria albata]
MPGKHVEAQTPFAACEGAVAVLEAFVVHAARELAEQLVGQ